MRVTFGKVYFVFCVLVVALYVGAIWPEVAHAQSRQGATLVTLTADAVTPANTETLVTVSSFVGDTVTGSVTTYPVSSRRTLRLQNISIQFTSSTTTANKIRVRLRTNATGACTASSNLVGTWELALPTGTLAANDGQAVLAVDLGEMDFQVGAGRNVCISAVAAAANGTLTLAAVGYEY